MVARGSDFAIDQVDMNVRKILLLPLFVAAFACGQRGEEAKKQVSTVATKTKEKVAEAFDVSSPEERQRAQPNPQDVERQRFDEQWRQLQSFREQQAALQQQQQQSQQQTSTAASTLQFVEANKKNRESFKNMELDAINAAPLRVPISGDLKGPSVLKTQVWLDRLRFSVGALDGRWGRNSAISVWWWQRTHGLEATGEADEATLRSIANAAGAAPALVRHTLTDDDVKGPFVSIPEDVYEKEHLDCLCYESLLEKLGERFHVTQDFLQELNPEVRFSSLSAGQTIVVPNVREPNTTEVHDVAKIVVSISGNTLNAFDASGRLLFHAPTTVGSKYDPSPNEETKVVGVARNPHFHYQPTLFHEVPDTDPEAHLNPGPNSPVGVVWMALAKPHFGIHGTSDPESIGYASSHGCVRLTNWDAAELAYHVQPGVVVSFVDTRKGDVPPVAQ